MKPIYAEDARYRRCLPFVNWMTRHSFRHVRYIDTELIPRDGAIIFAPNHTNALMDALVLLALDNRSKVFVARADIFRQPTAAAFLRWLKILPIRRMRDGVDQVRQNDDTMDESVQTLVHGVSFCIFAEGTHHPTYDILPLKKGICRIAEQAHHALASQPKPVPLYIVPVNIHYTSFTHLWDDLTVRVGEPMPVARFFPTESEQTDAQQQLQLLRELTGRMNDLAEQNTQPEPLSYHGIKRWMVILLLILLAPLALLCALLTFPIQLARPIIARHVEDECFRNSVQYAVQLICVLLSLGLAYLPHVVCEEYTYHLRRL